MVGAQKRYGCIGDGFGGVEVQLFELLQLRQPLDSAIRDVRQRQVEPLEILEAGDPFHIAVGSPSARQRYLDDTAFAIADDIRAVGRNGSRTSSAEDESRGDGDRVHQ